MSKMKAKYYAWIGQDDDGKLEVRRVMSCVVHNPERQMKWLERRKLTDHNAVLVADWQLPKVLAALRCVTLLVDKVPK